MKRRIRTVSASCMLLLCSLSYITLVSVPCDAEGSVPVSPTRPLMPVVSEDGSTIVKYSMAMETSSEIVDIVFCDGTGKERSRVEGKHAIDTWCLSSDGYFLIYGLVKGQKERFLTLYNPDGQRCFEKAFPRSCTVISLSTTAKGWRTAAIYVDSHNRDAADEDCVTLFDSAGSVLSKLTRKQCDGFWLQFTPDGNHVLLASDTGLHLHNSKDLSLIGKTDGLKLGHLRRDALAVTSDLSRLALYCSVSYGADGPSSYCPTVLVLDTESGKLLNHDRLPKNFNPADKKPIAYNAAKTRFEVTSADKTVYEVANK